MALDKQKFGAFVSALRKEQNLTQKELAARLHTSDKAVSKWETGTCLPDVSLLMPLAEVLGITVTELLRGERITQHLPPREVDGLLQTAICFDTLNETSWWNRLQGPKLSALGLATGIVLLNGLSFFQYPDLNYGEKFSMSSGFASAGIMILCFVLFFLVWFWPERYSEDLSLWGRMGICDFFLCGIPAFLALRVLTFLNYMVDFGMSRLGLESMNEVLGHISGVPILQMILWLALLILFNSTMLSQWKRQALREIQSRKN